MTYIKELVFSEHIFIWVPIWIHHHNDFKKIHYYLFEDKKNVRGKPSAVGIEANNNF